MHFRANVKNNLTSERSANEGKEENAGFCLGLSLEIIMCRKWKRGYHLNLEIPGLGSVLIRASVQDNALFEKMQVCISEVLLNKSIAGFSWGMWSSLNSDLIEIDRAEELNHPKPCQMTAHSQVCPPTPLSED